MSLLNKVLRDLDARQASDTERLAVPVNVKPLPSVQGNSLAAYRWLLAAGLLLIAGLLAYVMFEKKDQPPPPTPTMPQAAVPQVAAPAPAMPTAASGETLSSSSAFDLKLERAPLSSLAPSVVPDGKANHRVPVSRSAPVESRAADVTVLPEAKAGGSIKGKPIAESSNQTGVASDKIVVSPAKGGHDEASYRKALALAERGESAEAEAQLLQILDADPSYHAARQALFTIYAASGRQNDAAALLADGLRLDPGNTQWAMNLARLQVERNDNAAAWETLQRALPYARQQAEYRAFCGTVLQRLNRIDEASAQYDAALRINPTEGRWWVGYALTLEAGNKIAESREAFSRAQAAGNLTPELAAFVESKLRR